MTEQVMPKFHETFIPILNVLSNHETMPTRKLAETVKEKHYSHLPHDLLVKKVASGDNTLINRISWGKSYLKQSGYIDQVSRGVVRINDKGLEALQIGKLTLRDVKSQPEYIAHRKLVDNQRAEENIQQSEDSSPEDLIESGIELIDNEVKAELIEKLSNIDPYYFETIILKLLNRMGYGDFIGTPKSSDGGIDGIINEDELGLAKIYIQAKRYQEGNKVHEKDIRNFIGAMSGDTDKGVFVTTSSFDAKALEKASQARHKLVLIDGNKLVDLMFKHDIGVQTKQTYEIKSIDEDFFIEE